MRPARGAARRWLVFAACCVGSASCAAPAARFATRDPSEPLPARRAPGVVVDLKSELPSPSAAQSAGSGLVVLSAPRDTRLAPALVREFFRAVTSESNEALDALLASDAQLETSSGKNPLRSAWRTRFAQLDYSALRATPLYRERDLETYQSREHAVLGTARGVPSMQPGDVFVRVRLGVTHVNKTRVFADELGFLLRPSGAGYRIATISEDFLTP